MAAKKISASRKKSLPAKKTAAAKKTGPGKKTSPKKKADSMKKKTARAVRQKPSPKSSQGDKWVILMTTVFFCMFVVFVAYVLLHPNAFKAKEALKEATQQEKQSFGPLPKKEIPLKKARFEKPDFEIFPEKPVPSRKVIAARTTPKKRQHAPHPVPEAEDRWPMISIIIDDMGNDMDLAKRFLALDTAVTCAILPHSRYCREVARLAGRTGHEVMLHQPMEPGEYPMIDPGPGALLSAMTPDERIRQLNANIDLIPGVCGVNNHMGSKTTTLSDEMNQIFTVLKKRGLFFIDSRTTAATVSLSSARLFKVPFAERDVFLDHVLKDSEIQAQIERLVDIAQAHGKSLGIGHPHEQTYRILKKALPGIKKRARLIPASKIVEIM